VGARSRQIWARLPERSVLMRSFAYFLLALVQLSANAGPANRTSPATAPVVTTSARLRMPVGPPVLATTVAGRHHDCAPSQARAKGVRSAPSDLQNHKELPTAPCRPTQSPLGTRGKVEPSTRHPNTNYGL
jgi:hypothetical protein